MDLIVHVVEDEIRLIVEIHNATSAELACKFPFGDLYARYLERQGVQWRLLQRGRGSYYDALLPINVDQLPEIVQVVHACTS